MARWERDVGLRRRLAYLVAAAEVASLSLCFYFIFQAYAHQVAVRVGLHFSATIMYILVIVGAALCAAGTGLEGMAYVKGRRWARLAFLTENGAMIAMGVLWFVHNHFIGEAPNREVARWGLVLPMVTLFPLLWPLSTFRPNPPTGAQR
jgi:hypothetical protein